MLLSSEPGASTPQSGSDPILDMMKKYNIPVTRSAYLELAYFGDPPEELSAEEELSLPPELRSK